MGVNALLMFIIDYYFPMLVINARVYDYNNNCGRQMIAKMYSLNANALLSL